MASYEDPVGRRLEERPQVAHCGRSLLNRVRSVEPQTLTPILPGRCILPNAKREDSCATSHRADQMRVDRLSAVPWVKAHPSAARVRVGADPSQSVFLCNGLLGQGWVPRTACLVSYGSALPEGGRAPVRRASRVTAGCPSSRWFPQVVFRFAPALPGSTSN